MHHDWSHGTTVWLDYIWLTKKFVVYGILNRWPSWFEHILSKHFIYLQCSYPQLGQLRKVQQVNHIASFEYKTSCFDTMLHFLKPKILRLRWYLTNYLKQKRTKNKRSMIWEGFHSSCCQEQGVTCSVQKHNSYSALNKFFAGWKWKIMQTFLNCRSSNKDKQNSNISPSNNWFQKSNCTNDNKIITLDRCKNII